MSTLMEREDHAEELKRLWLAISMIQRSTDCLSLFLGWLKQLHEEILTKMIDCCAKSSGGLRVLLKNPNHFLQPRDVEALREDLSIGNLSTDVVFSNITHLSLQPIHVFLADTIDELEPLLEKWKHQVDRINQHENFRDLVDGCSVECALQSKTCCYVVRFNPAVEHFCGLPLVGTSDEARNLRCALQNNTLHGIAMFLIAVANRTIDAFRLKYRSAWSINWLTSSNGCFLERHNPSNGSFLERQDPSDEENERIIQSSRDNIVQAIFDHEQGLGLDASWVRLQESATVLQRTLVQTTVAPCLEISNAMFEAMKEILELHPRIWEWEK